MKIKFSGTLSGEAKKHIHTVRRKEILIMCPSILLFCLPIIWGIAYLLKNMLIVTFSMLILAFFLLSPAFLPFLIKMIDKKELPQSITLKEDDTIEAITERGIVQKKISNVENVTDYGAFYVLIFLLDATKTAWSATKEQKKLGQIFVCQKSLLTEGTVEEFEKLFEGKIVRKSW